MLTDRALFDKNFHILFHPFPGKMFLEPLVSGNNPRMSSNGTSDKQL
jgi:hypothetical protein